MGTVDVFICRMVLENTAGVSGSSRGAQLFIALLLIYINKHYNVLRSISYLFAGLFLVMEAALPTLFVHMSDGIFIAVVVLLSLIPLYTTFQDSERTRRVFLSFCIVSAGALVDITCAAYLIALFGRMLPDEMHHTAHDAGRRIGYHHTMVDCVGHGSAICSGD